MLGSAITVDLIAGVSMGTTTRLCSSCGASNRIAARDAASRVRCGTCKLDLPHSDVPIDVDVDAFNRIVERASVPILVDFWAAWCGPCRMAAPEVAKVAREMTGKALVLKVDTEAQPALAARFRVQSIPNFVVLKRGETVRQQPGLVDARTMRVWLVEAAQS